MRFISKYFLAAMLLASALMLHSCLEDLGGDSAGTEINITFDQGPKAGQTISLLSNNSGDDLQFYLSQNKTKVFCQPLVENNSTNLATSSSINWAFEGSPGAGNFQAIFFSNSSAAVAGDIDLSYTNGEYINCTIPKGAIINISEYGDVGARVIGTMSFTGVMDYEVNGVTQRLNSGVQIEFKIKRGKDVN